MMIETWSQNDGMRKLKTRVSLNTCCSTAVFGESYTKEKVDAKRGSNNYQNRGENIPRSLYSYFWVFFLGAEVSTILEAEKVDRPPKKEAEM